MVQYQAWSQSTLRTRKYQWKKYLDFCNLIGHEPLPLDVEVIAIFLLHLALQGLAYVSINNQVSAIVPFGKLHGSMVDIRGDFNIRLIRFDKNA